MSKTKLEYLKLCVQDAKPLEDLKWYINTMGIPTGLTSDISTLNHLDPYLKPDGMYFVEVVEGQATQTKISDYAKDKPLFLPRDRLEVDSTWLKSIKSKMETNVGRLLINTVAIDYVFKDRVEYINKQFDIGKLQDILSVRVVDQHKLFADTPNSVSVQEYLDCIDRCWFFSKISKLVTVAASEKIITAAPGIDKLREKLLKENQDKLSDPVVVASVADQLNQYDVEYLKDDMAAKLILTGNKKGNTARKKMYQMYGDVNDFDQSGSSMPITGTMNQGVDTSDDVLPKYINDLRYASYSRGHSTQLSGYSYKILQRSLSGLEVTDQDCMTTKGLKRVPTKGSRLVNRYVSTGGSKWTLVETPEQGDKYLGQVVTVRSPMYCQSKGNTICYKCLGENYKGIKNAVNNIAANFSGELMTLFLKRMHTSGYTLTTINPEDLFT